MELSERYRKLMLKNWVYLVGGFFTLIISMSEMKWVLPRYQFSLESDWIGLLIVFLFVVQITVLQFASALAVAFIGACIQQLLQTNRGKATKHFSLNVLSYRLFYASASRVNVLVFGFFIGMCIQATHLINSSTHANDWVTLAWFFGSLIQGIIIQFFLQSWLITLHYVVTYLLMKGAGKQIKRQLTLIKKQAVHPANLIASFVGMPFFLMMGYSAATLFSISYSLNQLFTQISFISLFLYIEVTLILYILDVRQIKSKTKT